MEKSSLKLRILPFIYVGIVLIVGYLFISSILKINYNNKHKKDVEVTTIEDTMTDDNIDIFDDGSNSSITIDDVTNQDDTAIIEDNNDKKPAEDNKSENKIITATSITLNKNSTAISIGGSEQLYASLTPKDVTNKNISWITNNSKVATVSNGVVKGVSAGTAVITVKTSNGKTATCKVTVYKNRVAVKSISLSKNSITLYAGSTYQLKASINPINATNQKIRWISSNYKVAVVSSTGKVGGKSAGTATIKAISEDGNKVAECKVTVKTNNTTTSIPVSNVSISSSSYSVVLGGQLTLKAIITPSNATNKTVSWSSSNTSVATVSSSGVVTGKKGGQTVKITARTSNGMSKSVTITVKPIAAKVTYTCPSGYTKSGSGSSTKCTLTKSATVTYTCPSGYTKSGSGSSTKCTITKNATKSGTKYTCPSGYTKSGSGSSTKCTLTKSATANYTCPSGYTKSGSGSSTKCTLTKSATVKYSCSIGTLSGTSCY